MSGFSPPRPSTIGVLTPVGCTVLTRILCWASSLAMVRAMPTTPCLAATYGARNGRPLMPAVELVQMIDPRPAAMRCGAQATMVFHTPVRLVSRVSCHTAGVTSSHACTVQMPAFAQTMSRCPSCATPSSTAAFSAAASRTSVGVAMIRRSSASTSLTVSARSASVDMP